jgi:hypothetical protein
MPVHAVSLANSLRRQLPTLAVSVMLIWLGCALAYQVPFSLHLAVGGDPHTYRREDDAPFLQMVHAAEPASPMVSEWWQLPGADDPYRWTQPESVLYLPGIGGGRWLVAVRAQGGRPDGGTTVTEWQFGHQPPITIALPAAPARRYTLLVPADGTVHVRFRSEPLQAEGDPRLLGFVLRDVQVSSTFDLRSPDWGQLGWIGVTIVALWLWGQSVALPTRWIIGLISMGSGVALAALIVARLAVTLLMPFLAGMTLVAAIVSIGLVLRWPQHLVWWQAMALTKLALIVRLAGLLHPHAISSDVGFHANNLLRLGLGQVLLTAGLPADSGGGMAPYPAGFYLVVLPFQLLLSDDFATRRLLVTVMAAALDSLFCLAIWWWVKQAGFSTRAALLSAACYIGSTQALEALSIGELANVGGQALILPALIGLSLGATGRQSSWLSIFVMMLAIAAGLLAHSGVTLGFGLLIAWAWILAWRQPSVLTGPRRLLLAGGGGLIFVLIVVYTAPPYLELIGQRGEQGVAGGQSPGQILFDTLLALAGLQPPQRRSLPIPFALLPATLCGVWLIWRASRTDTAGLRWLLGMWWGGALSGLALLLVADQGLRWALFLYPALCIPVGVVFDHLATRSTWQRWLAISWLALILGQSMSLWIGQIRDYLH